MSDVDQPTQSPLDPIQGPELVFGLVGPIGTDMRLISDILEETLSEVTYKVTHIHVTDLLDGYDYQITPKIARDWA